MTPQGGPPSAGSGHPMSGYPSHQSPMGGPSPGGRYPPQPQAGYNANGMGHQVYGQMPTSAGGYGRDQHPAPNWSNPPSAGGYHSGGHGQPYSGYPS